MPLPFPLETSGTPVETRAGNKALLSGSETARGVGEVGVGKNEDVTPVEARVINKHMSGSETARGVDEVGVGTPVETRATVGRHFAGTRESWRLRLF